MQSIVLQLLCPPEQHEQPRLHARRLFTFHNHHAFRHFWPFWGGYLSVQPKHRNRGTVYLNPISSPLYHATSLIPDLDVDVSATANPGP